MRWSAYNTLFQSERFGYFLYNALSNTLMELNSHYYKKLEYLKEKINITQLGIEDDFFSLLYEKHMIVKNGEEERLLLEKEDHRNTLSYNSTELGLTICPTLSCNFNCAYCFEDTKQHKGKMENKTVKQLMLFVKKFKNVEKFSVTWYGGEPTLNFKLICDISAQLDQLDINFDNATLITNGYLLTPSKVNLFNELHIKSIQITLDGPQEIHDKRRQLSSGHPTFKHILDNIHMLLDSSYDGDCVIRVNIDKSNMNSFKYLYAQILDEFKGKPVKVYPGRVEILNNHSSEHSTTLSVQEWSDFILQLYRENGIMPVYGLYPCLPGEGLCVANSENSFIIGPEGEMYKCWENVGDEKMVMGNIFDEDYITRPDIVAMYRVGTDLYRDPVCLDCKTLPICGGGCVNRRLHKKYYHDDSMEYCSPLRDNLETWLEEYYDSYLTANLCSEILMPSKEKIEQPGYKLIQLSPLL